MKRDTQNIVLFLVGTVIMVITVSGTYTRYVKPTMLPWLITAAVVIIVLAGSAIHQDIRHHNIDEHVAHHGGGHEHHTGVVWLLTIPIVVLGFIVPPALTSRTAPPTVTAVSNDVLRRPFPPLPAERAPNVALPEVLMRIATDTSDTLSGRLITVTGFTIKDGATTDLAKIVMSCCAADAQLARLRLTGPAAGVATLHPDNTWLSVEGTVPSGQHLTGMESVPVIQVTKVTPIDPPKTPYGN